MDPQSQSFTPHTSYSSENWRISSDIAKIEQVQTEHAERIARLERKQEDDARMKSVWGNQSPFPSVLSGTPQQAPVQHPLHDHFRGFDEETSNLMSSLQLDAEDEPRRGTGANSRANSVRFDESANQNHFSHSSRHSADFLSRANGGLGGLQMTERTSSHKSEGRASSAHSIRSAASGRANSINLDNAVYSLGDSQRSPSEMPGLAPGLFLLGAVPAIIRCWMNTNFKHNALLYAAVCTGSYKSFLNLRLIQKLGFDSVIRVTEDGLRMVKLPVFFPEAVRHPTSSRSSSPAPHLPSLLVDFRVIETTDSEADNKAIQIFLGSDVLREHNADILFSSNTMTLFDNERNKLSIPLSRPENEASFNTLHVTSGGPPASSQVDASGESTKHIHSHYSNCLGPGSSTASLSSAATSPPPGKYPPPVAVATDADSVRPAAPSLDKDSHPPSRLSTASRPSLTRLSTKSDHDDAALETSSQTTPLRPSGSTAVWGSWRRDGGSSSASTHPSGMDWASAGRNRDTPYQRKDTGIKVLKPKTGTRTLAATPGPMATSAASPSDGRSRFFDDGRRRSITESSKPSSAATAKEGAPPATVPAPSLGTAVPPPKTKANPIGGASAFSWLNTSGAGGGGANK